MWRVLLTGTLAAALLTGCAPETGTQESVMPPSDPYGFVFDTVDELPVVYETGFPPGELANWEPTVPSGWRIEPIDGNHVLHQYVRETDYDPPVRSPFNRAILTDPEVEDFVLEVRVKSTVDDYPHRDAVIIFGYQDDTHFYYAHFGKTADDQAHTVHIVDGAPRRSIVETRTAGTPWTDDWHVVRVIRDASSGKILAYFDDMDNPVMEASDTTFARGRIGLGTFDDTAMFDDLQLWGQ